MTGLESAINGLRLALDSPRQQRMWRWLVRNRLAGVEEALRSTGPRAGEEWLAARELALQEQRNGLVRRLGRLAPFVVEHADVEAVHRELGRLVRELEHYQQRLNDLVYDAVSLELGGSE